MDEINLRGLNIAIMGGSNPCKEILQLLLSNGLKDLDCRVLAVADSFTRVEGLRYAEKRKLFTTNNYNDIFKLENLDLILKFAQDENLFPFIEKAASQKIKLLNLDHSHAMDLITHLKIEIEKIAILKNIKTGKIDKNNLEDIFNQFSDNVTKIAEENIWHYKEIGRAHV